MGFIVIGVLVALIAGVVLWLLSLVVSVVSFNWIFVLIIGGIAGLYGGYEYSS